MSKKHRLIIFILMALAVGALALNRPVDSAKPMQQENPAPAEAAYEVPEHVVYRHLFHHAHVINQEAGKAELRGDVQAASSLRSFYKHEAALNEEQGRLFDQVAAECEREVNEQDRKAQAIIKKFRAQFPGGRVPNGEPLPPPSPELAQMQTERNAIILRARDRLREAFGEEAFSRFRHFIKVKVAPNIRPMSPEQLSAGTEAETR